MENLLLGRVSHVELAQEEEFQTRCCWLANEALRFSNASGGCNLQGGLYLRIEDGIAAFESFD